MELRGCLLHLSEMGYCSWVTNPGCLEDRYVWHVISYAVLYKFNWKCSVWVMMCVQFQYCIKIFIIVYYMHGTLISVYFPGCCFSYPFNIISLSVSMSSLVSNSHRWCHVCHSSASFRWSVTSSESFSNQLVVYQFSFLFTLFFATKSVPMSAESSVKVMRPRVVHSFEIKLKIKSQE